MSDTKLLKHRKSKMPLIKKYLIYKDILKGIPIRKISKKYNCSTESILKIKKKIGVSKIPYFEIDELTKIIHKIRVKHPFFTLRDVKNYIKRRFGIDISISTIYYKVGRYGLKVMNEEVLELFKLLIENNETEHACEILRFFRLPEEEYYLLEKLPEKDLPLTAFCDKLIYLMVNQGLTQEEQENYLSLIKKLLKKYKKTIYYFELLFVKIIILRALNRSQEIYELYLRHKNEIDRLPTYFKIDMLIMISDAIVPTKPNISKSILFKVMKTKLAKSMFRENIFRMLVNLGYINLASKYSYEPSIELFRGNYRKFISEIKNYIKDISLKHIKVINLSFLSVAKLFSLRVFDFVREMNNLKALISNDKFHRKELNIYFSLKYAIEGNYKKAREILRKDLESSRIIKAIILRKTDFLSIHRKQELLLKYLIKGNLKKAISVAHRYNLIFQLHLYTLLLNKSQKRLRRYSEFKNIIKLLRILRSYIVKVFVLREKERVYVNTKQIRNSDRLNKAYLILYYLLSENKKIARIEEINFADVKRCIYRLNHELGFKLISVKNGYIKLNTDVYFDLNEFLKLIKDGKESLAKRIFKKLPFLKAGDYFDVFYRIILGIRIKSNTLPS